MSDIKVRVGQQNSVKLISSVSGGSAYSENSRNSTNVIGGIASVTQLNVSGIATFVNGVNVNSNLYITNDLTNVRNVNITGIATISGAFYYGQYNTGGVAYFNSSGLMVSTGSTTNSINYTNYILTTNDAGITTWSNTIDGGSY
jgi:hypothetical protein